MKIGRLLMVIIGATLGSLVAVWWVRNYGMPLLPESTHHGMITDESGEQVPWIRLD